MRRTPPTLQQMPKTENRGKTLSLHIWQIFRQNSDIAAQKEAKQNQTRLFKKQTRDISDSNNRLKRRKKTTKNFHTKSYKA